MSQAGSNSSSGSGGLTNIEKITVQASTAPGTNPVVADASNNINVNGTIVAAHDIPIRTDSLAANTFNVELQYSSAVAATDATKVGLAAFNSTQFSVDANGFVSSLGSTTDYHASPFIVSAGGASAGAQYTTIAAAYAAAPADSIIIIQAGTYTENLTLTKNMAFTSLYSEGNGDGANVTITGKISDGGNSVACTFYGIGHGNSGDYGLDITGGSDIIYTNCQLDINNHNFLNFNTSGSGNVFVYDSTITYHANNVAFEDMTAGVLRFFNTDFFNDGGSTVSGTLSGGTIEFHYSECKAPYSTTGTQITAVYSRFNTSPINVTPITLGTSGTHNFEHCEFLSGTATSIVIGAGTTCNVYLCEINSDNADAISGAGNINYGGLIFINSQSINVTNMFGAFLPQFSNGNIGEVWTSNGPNISPTFQAAGAGTANMGPYIVGTENANYSTIQAAINAAQGTGIYSAFHPVDIVVKPKSDFSYYTENLTLYDGINIVALDTGNYNFSSFQDFENSVVIVGKISAPSTDQSLNKFVNVQIETIADSFIDYPGTGFMQEIDFTGCQIVINHTNPLFSNSGGGALTNQFVCFDNCFIGDSGSAIIYQDADWDPAAILNLTFNRTSAVFSGTTTVSQTTLSIKGSSSSIDITYDGSAGANIIVQWAGEAAAQGWFSFNGSINCVNLNGGSSLNFQHCTMTSAIQVNDITPSPGNVFLIQCPLIDTLGNEAQFLGTCVPTLFGCTGGCDYHKVQTTQTGPYTTLVIDDIVPVDTTGGAVTITLYASPFVGMTQTVKDVGGNALVANITVNGNGSNIDAGATDTIATNYGSRTYTYNGTIWGTVAKV